LEHNLMVSSSPHVRAREDTRSIMADVLIALFFPLAVAIFFFGWRSLALTLCSAGFCVLFEALYCKLLSKSVPVRDGSAAVTGVLLAFTLPVATPYWVVILGDLFAIVVVKQLYGGIGKNFLNPALAARAFLGGFDAISIYPEPQAGNHMPLWGLPAKADILTAATPLSQIHAGARMIPPDADGWQNLFLGQIGGCLGEVSTAVLLLGGLYLVVRKVITPRIPLCFIGKVALLTFFFPRCDMTGRDYMLYNLLSGGLMLGAVFMATDYSTSPISKRGQMLFGVGCGALTVFFRYFASMPEGVCYAILLMNTLAWTLDKIGRPGRFGKRPGYRPKSREGGGGP